MKILLVCAGGMSTSILMRKMEQYWKEAGEELEIKAVGLGEYQDVYQKYDIVLVGPQVSYRIKEIKENTNLPCAAIESFDYAVANCPNIMRLAKRLYAEKNN
ncbi:MAG: PTS sugar transporter subunit IIB [Clostridiales bacterium]|uniref:PTS sugar transporter subunit IIB n=1 Tax=Clostridium isatidis TaxID=182773 RepID=A0A343JEI3_9CLOT|nr:MULTISPECIES: PTS sugar transporter subunit IIB [Eubacteriales]ASW43941.1 PTS sugar transporter subunit IIB [Clostridium isatidis]MBU5455373.1 PTS sugar transporter subunit IIB [Caproiciproducens sp. MSJ-32]NLZ49785.1 PTS sugar transporter subunit IIB [Clostridiales bacterium]